MDPTLQPPPEMMAPPMQPPPEMMVAPAAPPPANGRERGTVSRWTERGFGFITPKDGGEDLFCHFSNIEDGNSLEPGTVVEFVKIFDDRKGKERAEQVTGGVTVERYGGGFGGGGGGRGICFDWQKGQCTRGAACRFSHDGDGGGGFGGGFGGGGFGGGFGGGGGGGGGGGHRVCFDWQKGQCTRGYVTARLRTPADAYARAPAWPSMCASLSN